MNSSLRRRMVAASHTGIRRPRRTGAEDGQRASEQWRCRNGRAGRRDSSAAGLRHGLLLPVLMQPRSTRPPAASSSSCVPCSTIRPPSSTTIRPAWRIVERRCAITIAVRPASSRRRPSSMRVSVWMSTFEVASSRIEDARVGDQRARERDQLALPGRQLHAALADLGVVAERQVARRTRRRRRRRPPRRSPRRRVRAAEGDVLADRAAEQEALLRHDPHARAQRARRRRRAGRGRRPARRRAWGRRSARRASRTSTCRRPSRRRGRPSARRARAGRRRAAPMRRRRRRHSGTRRPRSPARRAARRAAPRPAGPPARAPRPAARRSCRAPPCRTGRSCRAARAAGSGRRTGSARR